MRQHVIAFMAASALLVSAAEVPADRAGEIARLHLNALGGQGRVDALKAFRASGRIVAAGGPARFTMIAARPNRVRMEFRYGDRTVVQASDGAERPWELRAGGEPAPSALMDDTAAKAFLAEAEFDDPLVAGAAHGYLPVFEGEITVDGRKLLRLRVTKNSADPFFLLLDPDTYFIVLRIEPPAPSGGRRGSVVTRYDDFRPVAGVLVPHEISVHADGRLLQQAKIEEIEPNPPLPADVFARPPPGRVP